MSTKIENNSLSSNSLLFKNLNSHFLGILNECCYRLYGKKYHYCFFKDIKNPSFSLTKNPSDAIYNTIFAKYVILKEIYLRENKAKIFGIDITAQFNIELWILGNSSFIFNLPDLEQVQNEEINQLDWFDYNLKKNNVSLIKYLEIEHLKTILNSSVVQMQINRTTPERIFFNYIISDTLVFILSEKQAAITYERKNLLFNHLSRIHDDKLRKSRLEIKSKITKESAPTVNQKEYFGYCGLANLGNTCYMNAAIHVLINAVDMKNYFIEPHQFQKEINAKNALGENTDIALQFSILMRQMWTSKQSYLVPSELRDLICSKYTHFCGYEQHDTLEFLLLLLNLLHQDLNSILKKPFYDKPLECESEHNTFDIAFESWKRFLTHENSVIIDNFYGQFKSKLTCRECHKISITFEPFNNLLVPLPEPKTNIKFVLMFHVRRNKMPVESNVFVNENDNIEKIFQLVKQKFGYLKQSTLKAVLLQKKLSAIDQNEEGFNNKKNNEVYFETDWKILDVNDLQPHPLEANKFILIYETEIDLSYKSNDPKIEFRFDQSCKFPSIPISALNKCSYCQKHNQNGNGLLPRCTRCFRSAYCNSECQRNDWEKHSKLVCQKPREAVGLPFILSFRKSELLDLNGEELFRCSLIDSCLYTTDIKNAIETNDERKDFLYINDYDIELLENDLLCKSSKAIILRTFKDLLDMVQIKNENISLRLRVNWKNQLNGVQTLNLKTNVNKIENMISDSNDLDGRASITLNDCLDLFTHPEKLTCDNPWYCSKCKKYQEATKQMSLSQLPKYLIITLKRFQASMSSHEPKLNNLVDFPLRNLDVSKYVMNRMQDKKNCIYDLCGVINHLGQSIKNGHYTAYARTHSAEDTTVDELPWRLFDDKTVVQIQNSSQIVSKDAYVLMYRLRKKPSDDSIDSTSFHDKDENMSIS